VTEGAVAEQLQMNLVAFGKGNQRKVGRELFLQLEDFGEVGASPSHCLLTLIDEFCLFDPRLQSLVEVAEEHEFFAHFFEAVYPQAGK
jgi:hypothetical protein